MNTLFALWTSVTAAIWTSKLTKLGKFSIDQIMNATLAGGIMIAASANLYTFLLPPLFVGAIAGVWSSLSFHFFVPWLTKWKLYDIRGVMHLHGTVGILGGVISWIAIATINSYFGATTADYFPYKRNS